MTAEKKKIIIVGCGPGAESYVTPAAREAAQQADVLIVSRRLQNVFPEIKAERIDSGIDIGKILDTIAFRRDSGQQVVLLATGDPGISSLARPVIRRFGWKNCEVIPGISSFQVAFARFGMSWQEARIITAHSRNPEVSAADLKDTGKLAILGGREGAIRWTVELIRSLGDDRRVFLCEELTLPGEKVREVNADELTAIPVSSRAIILIIKGELLI
jgi:cobalt-precorrin-7 (C5)-methyltransferase